MQQWILINKKADFKVIGEKFHIDQVTARIMRNRELVEEEDIRRFLSGDLNDLYNPQPLSLASQIPTGTPQQPLG